MSQVRLLYAAKRPIRRLRSLFEPVLLRPFQEFGPEQLTTAVRTTTT